MIMYDFFFYHETGHRKTYGLKWNPLAHYTEFTNSLHSLSRNSDHVLSSPYFQWLCADGWAICALDFIAYR